MNNQNSDKEKPTTIYFSPTGGILPPIEDENIDKGSEVEEGRVNHPKTLY